MNPTTEQLALNAETTERLALRDKLESFMHTSRQLGERMLRSTIDQWETLRQKNTVVRELTSTELWKAEWETARSQVQALPIPNIGEAYNTATAWVSTTYMIERGEAGIFNPSAFKSRLPWNRRHGATTATRESTTSTSVNNKNFSKKTGVALAVVLGGGALYLLSETYPGNDVFGNRILDPLDVDANVLDGEFAVDFFDQDVDGKVKMGGEQPLDTELQQAFSDSKEELTELAQELDQEIPDIDDGDWPALNDWEDELREAEDEVLPPEGELFGPEAPEIDTDNEPDSGSSNNSEKGQVFYVEPTHGITHEIIDYAQSNGYGSISPEESYRMYQQLEAQHANALLDLLHGVDDTYVDENGDTLLSRSGNARWDPAVEAHLRRMLTVTR